MKRKPTTKSSIGARLGLGLAVELGLVLGLGLGSATANTTFPVRIADVIAGDSDKVEDSVFIGSSGQVYVPVEGAWRRAVVGGVAVEVRGVVRGPKNRLYVAGSRAPVYRFSNGAWHTDPLPNRGTVVVGGAGSAPVLAINRHVYLPTSKQWKRGAAHLRRITAVWRAKPHRVYIADVKSNVRVSTGGSFTRVRHNLAADDYVVAFAGSPRGELYALSSKGVILFFTRTRGTTVSLNPQLSGLQPQTLAPAPGGGVLIAGVISSDAGQRAVLVRATKGRLRLEHELAPLPAGDSFSAMRTDSAGSVLLATRRGEVHIRDPKGNWRKAVVSGVVPPAALRKFSGGAPARSN